MPKPGSDARWIAVALLLCACSSDIKGASEAGAGGAPGGAMPGAGGAGGATAGGAAGGTSAATLGFGANGITRLSRAEYRATLQSLLGVDMASDVELLPADSFTPFDNDYRFQVPSKALVEGLQAIADRALAKVLADPALTARLVGCVPASVSDATCLSDFIRRFGRRALRRPLADAEVNAYLGFQSFAVAANDFNVAISMVARAMLQDLEFAYRVEIGQPVAGRPGVSRLDDWETASRLAYFLWGENPDDVLLDQAQQGKLRTESDVRAAAERMLADERGVRRIQRFHALWMGYETLPHAPELNAAMREETDALVKRVVFDDQRPWLDLFSSTETWANLELGALYGVPGAGATGFSWLKYPTPDRRGILSHGSLLSNGFNGTDTSPTRRGKFIQERLACTPIPPPPPDVKADQPPPAISGDNCKIDRYAAHRTEARCAGCHALMDGIGFGLENYDHRGAYRANDTDKPQCKIEGAGDLAGGAFHGPAELGALLAQSGELSQCLIQRVFQFGVGRDPRADDAVLLDALARNDGPTLQLRQLLLDWVSSEGFRNHVVDEL